MLQIVVCVDVLKTATKTSDAKFHVSLSIVIITFQCNWTD